MTVNAFHLYDASGDKAECGFYESHGLIVTDVRNIGIDATWCDECLRRRAKRLEDEATALRGLLERAK